MKETIYLLQTYEIFLKLIYLKHLQENLSNEIIGFTDKTGEEESVYYTVTDIQGSIKEVYDNDSNLVWKSGYTAFGEIAGEVVDLIDFDGMYTGCDYDAETGLTYHWNRWRSEDGSAFISEDPARDGSNWYGYAGCNPMVYVDRIGLFYYTAEGQQSSTSNTPKTDTNDSSNKTPQNQSPNKTGEGPTGVPKKVSPSLEDGNFQSKITSQTSDEIMSEINKLQKEMNDYGEISESQFNMFMILAKNYNLAVIQEGKLSVDNYVKDGEITTDFEAIQDSVGNYKVNYHHGIDVVGGDLISPFFIIGVGGTEIGSNDKIFSVIGTNLRIRVLHGDSGSVIKSGDFFKPNDKIMEFPKKNNFNTASTGPHFHIDLSNGNNFVNPYTLKQSDKIFKTSNNGGETWFKTNYTY